MFARVCVRVNPVSVHLSIYEYPEYVCPYSVCCCASVCVFSFVSPCVFPRMRHYFCAFFCCIFVSPCLLQSDSVYVIHTGIALFNFSFPLRFSGYPCVCMCNSVSQGVSLRVILRMCIFGCVRVASCIFQYHCVSLSILVIYVFIVV